MKVIDGGAQEIRTSDIHGAALPMPPSLGGRRLRHGVGRKPRREVGYRFRRPQADDGTAIWELVKHTGVLDLNSAYSYIMLGEYFAETCILAERRGRIVGFVSGFKPPQREDTLFIWQVAVAESERGRGLARTLILKLLASTACIDVRYLEATVTPSNAASTRLFRAVARELETSCVIERGFAGELFPGDGHEAERLFRIGPFAALAAAA